jgi:hypothetical protein
MSSQWREEQKRCQREIERLQDADRSYLEEGVQLLELARNVQRLFEKQKPREKRRLLKFVLSNCEISVRTVRFHKRPVAVVAKSARPEESLLAIFPIFNGLSLWTRQAPLVDTQYSRFPSRIEEIRRAAQRGGNAPLAGNHSLRSADVRKLNGG